MYVKEPRASQKNVLIFWDDMDISSTFDHGQFQKKNRMEQTLHMLLVDGFNPFEKYSSNWIMKPQASGENSKNVWIHHHPKFQCTQNIFKR